MMAELGVMPNVIELALNHVSGHKAGVAGIYNRSKMTDAVREGLQHWADHLDKLTGELPRFVDEVPLAPRPKHLERK